MSSILAVFLFNFKSTFRNLKATGIMFILPIVFMAIFGLAFGGTNEIDYSLGIYQPESSKSSFELEKIFRSADESSSDLTIKTTTYSNLESLQEDLKKEKIDIGVKLVSLDPVEFEILLDSQDINATINKSVTFDILTSGLFRGKNPITTSILSPDRVDRSGFDFLAPGLIIYGLIILIPGIAQSFTELSEKKYLFRYAISKIKSLEIIFGTVLFFLFLGVIQVILLYVTALIFGYKASGSLALALLPAILSLLFVIAVGLIIGSFFDKTEGATNTGTIISIILGFFSGSFIAGIGNILKFDFMGRQVQFNDILPTKWGTQAMEKILSKNLGLVDIQPELWVLGISGLVAIGLSIWIYSQKQLSNQD